MSRKTTMRVITTSDGKARCYHCGRPFERHPEVVRREELHAKLCAIENDDLAARVFHYHRTLQAEFDSMEKVYVESSGYSIPDMGIVRFEGATIHLEPGASRERMMEEIERHVLPSIKEDILRALDPCPKLPETPIDPSKIRRYDPTWCPSTPSVAELYPSGYVRHEDGSVDAL